MGPGEKWYCGSCHVVNGPSRDDCWACGTAKKHGIPQSQCRENITQIICSDCGKKVDEQSARLFQTELFPLGYYSVGKEWIEVNWDKKGTVQPDGQVPEEKILCASCAKGFRKKKIEDEWRFARSYAAIAIFGSLAFIIYLFVVVFREAK